MIEELNFLKQLGLGMERTPSTQLIEKKTLEKENEEERPLFQTLLIADAFKNTAKNSNTSSQINK